MVTVTFLAPKHHHPSTNTKLYCVVTEAMCVNNLPKVALDTSEAGTEPQFPFSNEKSNAITTMPPNNTFGPEQMRKLTNN